jgi:RNA polymerase sigma-32 factor
MHQSVARLAGRNQARILSRTEEVEAARAWRDHRDEAARLLIFQAHMKVVAKEVRRMRFYRADPDDLYSEGMVGLTIALDKFDPEAGFRFYTYAIHWIRATLISHILLTEGVMRVSSSARFKGLFFSYRRASAEIADKYRKSGKSMTRAEIQEITADALGASVEDLRLIEAAMGQATSLDAPANTNDVGDIQTFADIIPSDAPIAEDLLNEQQVKKHLKSDIAAALDKLNPREKHIIATRKLAPADEMKTLEDLSQVYNISRERVRQIEVAALKKLETSLAPTVQLLDAA